jgi:hypothetical protein
VVGDTPHGIEIFSGDTAIFSQFVNYFDAVLAVPAAFKTNGTLDNPTFETKSFRLFPNPTSGILNFSTNETFDISIFDMTGKTVYKAESIFNGDSINLSSLQKGVYTARINSESFIRSEKVIIN